MAKRVIKLTESDLMRLVKKVVSEQSTYTNQSDPTLDKVLMRLKNMGYAVNTNTKNFPKDGETLDTYVIFEKEGEDGKFHRVTYEVYPAGDSGVTSK
jgi:hypothetical protein